MRIPVFFNPEQLAHRPLYEWAFGEKIDHPETSVRAERILRSIQAEPAAFDVRLPGETPLEAIRALHDPRLIRLLEASSRMLEEGATFHPQMFPRTGSPTVNPDDVRHAGYFCFDSGTPLARNTLDAALWSAACAQTAARHVRDGAPLAYALSRPPGHHATPETFGGYCYFNNAAVAAHAMPGRVALVDIDFHHGNGTQEIFYADDRVLFISIHGDPRDFYPFHWGYEAETGEGRGKGYNVNLPLPRGTDGQAYLAVLEQQVLPLIRRFHPESLIVSAGLDTFALDPIGSFTLQTADLHEVGRRLGSLGLPTVMIQEGGYQVEALGTNAVALLRGVRDGLSHPR